MDAPWGIDRWAPLLRMKMASTKFEGRSSIVLHHQQTQHPTSKQWLMRSNKGADTGEISIAQYLFSRPKLNGRKFR
jgi:hypothetical protein